MTGSVYFAANNHNRNNGRKTMTEKRAFAEQVESLKQKVRDIDETADAKLIEDTAQRLEKMGFTPPVMIPIAAFLRLNKDTLLQEIEKILAMPDQEACALAPNEPKKCEDLRIEFISVLIFYYEKLILLRGDDQEEWDEIDELYVHD